MDLVNENAELARPSAPKSGALQSGQQAAVKSTLTPIANNQRSRKPGLPGEQQIDAGAIDIKKGGAAIPYSMEDPNIRVEFAETLAKEGLANRMNPEFYDPDSKAADELGDVM